MKLKLEKEWFFFAAFFMIMLGDLQTIEAGHLLIYCGLGILLLLAYFTFLFQMPFGRWKAVIAAEAFVLQILMSIGILQQDLSEARKIKLLISYFIIVSLYVVSGFCFSGLKSFRSMGYGILAAYFAGMMIALVSGTEIFALTSEGFPIALTGGFSHKNIVSFSLFAAFMGIYLYRWLEGRTKRDLFLLIGNALLIILTNSRSVWLLFALFIAISVCGRMKDRVGKKSKRLYYVLIGVGLAVGILVLKTFVFKSANYALRLQGMASYLHIYGKDKFHLWYGNGATIYAEAGDFYSRNIWKLTGGNGTFEMGILNILAKMGIWGLLAYIIMLIKPLLLLYLEKSRDRRLAVLSIIVPLAASAFVEIAIQNINCVYAAFCWCIISYLMESAVHIRWCGKG